MAKIIKRKQFHHLVLLLSLTLDVEESQRTVISLYTNFILFFFTLLAKASSA